MESCPRVSAWWWIKISLALALVGQAVVVVGFGLTIPVLPVPWIVGQVVVLVGALFCVWHYVILKSASRDLARPDRLVTRGGCYRWVRHPMYLGDFTVIVGFALYCPSIFSGLAIPVAVVALERLARHEDRQMRDRFGEPFQAWSEQSRLLIPFLH